MHCNRHPCRIRPALLVDEGDPKSNSGIVATSPIVEAKTNGKQPGKMTAFSAR